MLANKVERQLTLRVHLVYEKGYLDQLRNRANTEGEPDECDRRDSGYHCIEKAVHPVSIGHAGPSDWSLSAQLLWQRIAARLKICSSIPGVLPILIICPRV